MPLGIGVDVGLGIGGFGAAASFSVGFGGKGGADRRYPYLSCLFAVEIDQQIVAGFSEVSGLELETEVETFREGGVHAHEQQLPGPTKFPSRLVLKRGMTDLDVLWSWYQEVASGRVTRKDVSILLLDTTGEEKRRWSFRDAAPVKWGGPQFRAATGEVAIETLELVHKGLIQSPGGGINTGISLGSVSAEISAGLP